VLLLLKHIVIFVYAFGQNLPKKRAIRKDFTERSHRGNSTQHSQNELWIEDRFSNMQIYRKWTMLGCIRTGFKCITFSLVEKLTFTIDLLI